MSDILSRYGIKEVADVTFYKIKEDGTRDIPVLYLDSLKVSTIEQTAEVADAKGGKGNPALISWDYGREITVTLEDALFSPKSLAVAFGSGEITSAGAEVVKTFRWNSGEKSGAPASASITYEMDGKSLAVTDPKAYDVNTGTEVKELAAKTDYLITGTLKIVSGAQTIEISAETFPGTYYVTGDTYARSETTGQDELFQFVIPKAKIQSENTLTMEAEGDPTVFNMNLKVLKPKNGPMMKLIKYALGAAG